MPRAYPGPGRQVRTGAEAAHVGTGLGDDHLGHGLAHARDRHQVLKLAGKRAHLLCDPGRQFGDRRGELVDTLQMQPAQKTRGARRSCRSTPAPGGGILGRIRVLAISASNLRVAFAVNQRGQHRPPGYPGDVGGHRRQLDPGVFEFLLQPLRLPAALGGQRGPVAGQVPQLPDRLRRLRTTRAAARTHRADTTRRHHKRRFCDPGAPLACAALTKITFS